ncbi:hypothetical protein [Paenibacillus mesotrionivorans]|jgi:hypothetical protein|uniref:Uncharacterized protein n=1 Tax=Paenibacillus mesotrionivorans TaxID=3160968 RepID=A0ACC7NXA5_9BACL
MKTHNCCGDGIACDIPVELPEDYMDTLYQMYVKDCEKEGKEPQTKAQWLENISA